MKIVVLTLISSVIFFGNINSFPLRNWDEAWYAEVIKNMATGDQGLLVSFWNGRYYFDKPPLYFWLSLPFFKIFGPGEWQARIVSSLASVFASVLVYLTGKKLFGEKAAILACLVFLTLGQVVFRFASGNLDALLVFFTLLTFYSYLLSEKKSQFSYLTGISLGLATLVKGWLPGIYPLLVIGLYSAFTQKRLPKNLQIILFFGFIASAWYYLLGYFHFGQEFINWFLLSPEGGLFSPSSFSLSYFKDLVRDIGFWWIIPLLFLLTGTKLSKKEIPILSSFGMAILIFIFPLNFLFEKLGWYNLPTYPLVALVLGFFAAKVSGKLPKVLGIVLFSLILILQTANVTRIENIYPDRSSVGASLGIVAKELIPKNETLILDDKDFTGFLYYSEHKEVFVSSPAGGKDWEWWILKYSQLDEFIGNNPNSWIMTREPHKLPVDRSKSTVVTTRQGYSFVKFNQ